MNKQALLEQAYEDSFKDELEKLSGAIDKAINAALGAGIGAGYGNVIGGLVSSIANTKKLRYVTKHMKAKPSKIVDVLNKVLPDPIKLGPPSSAKMVKKYAPDVMYIGDAATAKKYMTPLQRAGIGPAFKGSNAYYIPGKKPMIVGSGNINPDIVSHELGHHIDLSNKPKGILKKIKKATRSTVAKEKAAWDMAPRRIKNKELESAAFGTYKTLEKYQKGGQRVGAAVGGLIGSMV